MVLAFLHPQAAVAHFKTATPDTDFHDVRDMFEHSIRTLMGEATDPRAIMNDITFHLVMDGHDEGTTTELMKRMATDDQLRNDPRTLAAKVKTALSVISSSELQTMGPMTWNRHLDGIDKVMKFRDSAMLQQIREQLAMTVSERAAYVSSLQVVQNQNSLHDHGHAVAWDMLPVPGATPGEASAKR
jgi:hypothetical protein